MMLSYFLLFGASFLAATILPFYSEFLLYGLLREGGDPALLVFVAALGNTLGAVVNWYLGLFILRFQDRRWFYFTPKQVARAQQHFQKYGIWTLLFAWLPIGGDPLTLIAGMMKVKLWIFLILVGLGKTLRYVFIVYLADWFPV